MPSLYARILAVLPQTQCTRCGYPDCAAYASAIADGSAAINQCPPGGAQGIARIASLTGQSVVPLNPDNGLETPRSVAIIDESWCIGCTLCLPVCPTDAIMGSNKLMHSVIAAYCTGCELCIPVCPVDCISLENVSAEATGWDAWSTKLAGQAASRYQFHQQRLKSALAEQQVRQGEDVKVKLDAPSKSSTTSSPVKSEPVTAKSAVIAAALARARARSKKSTD